MKVSDAILSRHSARAFKATTVSGETIRRIINMAARAPSGGNLQPWHVWALTGEDLSRFKEIVHEKAFSKPLDQSPLNAKLGGETAEYNIYPVPMPEPYRSRSFACGEALYQSINVPREDKKSRYAHLARNFEFFGAPCALFFAIDKIMQEGQWADLGMFMQSIMLLAREEGLHTCAQECWALMPQTVRSFLGIPDSMMFFCGMAVGYADEAQPINSFRTERAPLTEFAHFRGFDDLKE